MRDFGTFRRCPRPIAARVGQRDMPPDGDNPVEADRHFTPTAVNTPPTGRVYVQLADEAGNPDGARREIFDSRD